MKNTYFLEDEPIPQLLCGEVKKDGPGDHDWVCVNTKHTNDRHWWVAVA